MFSSQIGFTANGKIKALDVQLYVNGGNSTDVSDHVSHSFRSIQLTVMSQVRVQSVVTTLARLLRSIQTDQARLKGHCLS